MSGRSEEFREFARDRAWPLQQAAYLLCGDWHSAQDVVQETLIKAYRHWPRVKRADNPDAYVRGILLNEVRGWAKGTLPTYQDRKQFFEGIVNGDPDPVALLREGAANGSGGAGEQAVRELIARAQGEHEQRLAAV